MKDVLTKLVEIAMKAKELNDSMEALGYQENPYWDMYTMSAEAIYIMIGENADSSFEESVTYKALNAPDLTTDQRVSLLLNA